MTLSGSITGQSLSESLRALSQRKRNGVLAVDCQGFAVRLAFQEGKIVQVHDAAKSSAVGICRRLTPSGILPDKVVALVEKSGVNQQQLHDLLVGKRYVTEEEFQRARTGYELDLLHQLRKLESGKLDFNSKLLRLDPKFQISVYPCQLLLDWVELDVDRERLAKLLRAETLEEVWESAVVCQTENKVDYFSDNEQLVYDLIQDGARLKDLAERSLLSHYQLLQSILSLLEQQVIATTEKEPEGEAENIPKDAKIEPQVLRKPDQPAEHSEQEDREDPREFSLEVGEITGQTSDSEVIRDQHIVSSASKNGLTGEQLAVPVSNTAVLFPESNSEGNQEIEFSEASLTAGQTAPNCFQDSPELRQESIPAQEIDGSIELEQQELSAVGETRSLFRRIDYALLNEQVTNRVVLATTLLYLASFALIGSDLFATWFKALTNFTSNG